LDGSQQIHGFVAIKCHVFVIQHGYRVSSSYINLVDGFTDGKNPQIISYSSVG